MANSKQREARRNNGTAGSTLWTIYPGSGLQDIGVSYKLYCNLRRSGKMSHQQVLQRYAKELAELAAKRAAIIHSRNEIMPKEEPSKVSEVLPQAKAVATSVLTLNRMAKNTLVKAGATPRRALAILQKVPVTAGHRELRGVTGISNKAASKIRLEMVQELS